MKPIRVLMIHHLFFPSQAMAAARAWRLVRRLPASGIEPVIVTGTPAASAQGSEEDGIDAADGGRIRVLRARGRDVVRRGGAQAGRSGGGSSRGKTLKRLARSFLVPDEMLGWVGAWTRAGRQAAADGIDLVFSSSTPYSAHLAGRRLARELEKPWVLEMRDLWADSPYIPHVRNPLTRPLQKRFEAMCVADARRVVVTTETHARRLGRQYAGIQEAIRVVPNAFEPTATSPVAARRASRGPLRILHSGNFYGGRSLSALGRAVDAVAGELSGFSHGVLEVAGKTYDLPWAAVLGGERSNRVVHGFLPAARIAELRGEVHAGVVHNPPWDTVHVPGKLYEYLGAGLPVLDLTSQEEIPKLCEGTVPCWKVRPDDVQGLSEALRALAVWWDEHPEGALKPGPDHAFSSLSVARTLAAVLREAAS